MSDTPTEPIPGAVRNKHKRAMLIVFLVVAIDLLGFGIVLPLMPRYADAFLRDYSAQTQGILIGLLYSSFSLMQFIFSPVWGRISDRIGRRPILLLGLTGSVLFYALFGYASTLTEQPDLAVVLLLLSRIGAGIAGASVSTAAAVIADCTPPERRAKGMALIGAAFGIGFTFGPLIAWAGETVFAGELWGPGAMASILSAMALLMAIGLLPETLQPGPKPPREFFSIGRSMAVLRNPAIGPLILIYFLAIFGFANFEGTLSLLTKEAFGMEDSDNYLAFAYVGFVLMVAQGGIYRPLAGRVSEQSLMTIGAGFMLIGLGTLILVAYGAFSLKSSPDALVGLKRMLYLAMTVGVVGFAFVNPSIASLISRRTDATRQGEVLGVNQSFAALGRILGPFVGSVTFKLDETRVLPYAIASFLLLIVIGLLPSARRDEGVKE